MCNKKNIPVTNSEKEPLRKSDTPSPSPVKIDGWNNKQ